MKTSKKSSVIRWSAFSFVFIGALLSLSLASCKHKTHNGNAGYPIEPVPFTSVTLNDQFWAPKIKTNHEITIPIAIEQSEISGRIKNFEIAGGLCEGEFCSQYTFDDSDIYKIIEAASFSLQTIPDKKLEAKLDSLIELIAVAQETDGYIFTNLTIAGKNESPAHPWVGEGRWDKVEELSHELYNLGHLFEAATAHFQATGKRNFLDIAIKAADFLDRTFGWGKVEKYPGHQVVEMGLVKMYLATGEKRYLDLARFFLDVRGPEGPEYCQAHAKVVNQTEAVGHAVRATYMYAAMADIAALYNDESYIHASRKIWEDMVYRKTYVTGGIGASGGNEGFDKPYELPNMAAYCETCASIGEIFWNYRMFLYDGESKYIDVLERALYNAFLSGVSLEGDRFFYPNVLESIGQHSRSKWFGCACCPPNLARLLPSLPGYIYSKAPNSIMVNLFMNNTANIDFYGNKIVLAQHTNFPWDGSIELELNPDKNEKFELCIRIPGWAQNVAMPGDLYSFTDKISNEIEIQVNQNRVKYHIENGYAIIKRKWQKGDKVSFEFPMEPRIITASDSIEADRNKMAIQRGPFVYAAEWPDVPDGKVLNLVFDHDKPMLVKHEPDLLNGVYTVHADAHLVRSTLDGGFEYGEAQKVRLIPYYAWNNRGPGEMAVWLPYNEESVRPLPAPTIASRSVVSASHPNKSLIALNDQLLPEHSNDHTWPYYHWWPRNNQWEWVQYNFEQAVEVSKVKIYWYDDGPFGGCRIPADWEIQYLADEQWKPVNVAGDYPISKDEWNEVIFTPVTSSALRLRVKLPEIHSAGIHEWIIEE